MRTWAHLGEDVVHKDQEIGGLIEKEELPCVWLELWIEGKPYGLDELARLDGDTGAYCEPSEDSACRTAVTQNTSALQDWEESISRPVCSLRSGAA